MQSKEPRALAALLNDLRADARFRHQVRHPRERPTWWSSVQVFASRGFWLLAVARIDMACAAWRPAGPAASLARGFVHLAVSLANRLAILVAKSEIAEGRFEGGVYLSDRGHIIVGVRSVGAGTVIHDRVTIGRGLSGADKPEIGRRVWIGSQCVIYGRARIGDGATVLPHTVVTKSVPPGSVVQGNPARLVRRDFDNTPLREGGTRDGVALTGVHSV